MDDIIKPTVSLFIICVIVSALLGLTYSVTADKIDERARLDAENSIKAVLADTERFEPVENLNEILGGRQGLEIIKEGYKGFNNDLVTGYVFLIKTKGYGGQMKITVGVDLHGKVMGVKIGENTETPGLGAKVKEPSFISQLENVTPKGPLKVIKGKKSNDEEISAISGATVTSKAVVEAVQAAVEAATELTGKEGV